LTSGCDPFTDAVLQVLGGKGVDLYLFDAWHGTLGEDRLLLFIPSTITVGAAMAVAATGSAILFHLTRLGIALTPVGDHGELFALAVIVCSIGVLVLHRQELPLIGGGFRTT
jgi:hypothetical protein